MWICIENDDSSAVPHLSPGIPTLVILDKECKTITAYGRAAVSADPEGKVSMIVLVSCMDSFMVSSPGVLVLCPVTVIALPPPPPPRG